MNLIILVAVALFQGYHISGLEVPPPCPLADGNCQSDTIVKLATTVGVEGSKELNISPVDPYHLENISIHIMDIIKLTLVKGDCLDIVKTCRHTTFNVDTEKKIRKIVLNCERVEFVGEYLIETNPNYISYFGNMHGNGNGSLILKDWYFYIEHPFDFVLGADNEIHFDPMFEYAKWETRVNTEATIAVDSIYLGDQDITAEAVSYVNENWKSLFTTFGKEFDWISTYYYFKDYKLLYSLVPAKMLFCDDLKPLIKKNCDQP